MSTKGIVKGIIANLVIVKADGPVSQNEIAYINLGDTRLMAEVIKVTGGNTYIQVFESTRGVKVGDGVDFEGHMLEVTLGPGILSRNYDGLQNDLDKMTGVFLKRGEYTYPLDKEKLWDFHPLVNEGDEVAAGSWLGQVTENEQPHKIMVPFSFSGNYFVKSIVAEGNYRVNDTIAILLDKDNNEVPVTMVQKWPVKRPVKAYKNKPRPFKLFQTGYRSIDFYNPLLEGGTGFVPGPFGTGKTVFQHTVSKQGEADIVVIAACGERANEVVEIFTEFPEITDSRTGRPLMERTTIIANTSNMPVAAREASVYTAMTIAEYYRNMGLKVLLLADSTSRWAQALREMSNRLEELPGQDAFPMDLSAIIANFYARAGFVELNNGKSGSVTFIGTVSPAGGNFKEPVTESTKKAARCFYGLQQQRADSKRHPAFSPLDSYSKYLEYPEFREWVGKNISNEWVDLINEAKTIMQRGTEIAEQINILGDDGVPVNYHITFWKSELFDFGFLMQDAYDDIDRNMPLDRMEFMVKLVMKICQSEFAFDDFNEVAAFFRELINNIRQMNYTEYESAEFKDYDQKIRALVEKMVIKQDK